MVDVEQRALRALEQDALAGAALAVEPLVDGVHVGQHFWRDAEQFLADRRRIDRREAETAPQRVVMRQKPGDLVVERVGIGEIAEADRAPADLVFVGRADAALGRADLGAALAAFLAMRVEFAMQRQDQRDVFGDLEIVRRHRDALRLDLRDLLDEMMRVEHDAVADDR